MQIIYNRTVQILIIVLSLTFLLENTSKHFHIAYFYICTAILFINLGTAYNEVSKWEKLIQKIMGGDYILPYAKAIAPKNIMLASGLLLLWDGIAFLYVDPRHAIIGLVVIGFMEHFFENINHEEHVLISERIYAKLSKEYVFYINNGENQIAENIKSMMRQIESDIKPINT